MKPRATHQEAYGLLMGPEMVTGPKTLHIIIIIIINSSSISISSSSSWCHWNFSVT